MKKTRQQKILQIISEKRIATQNELAAELARHKMAATQSSVSRDIVELGLTKVDGYYAPPHAALGTGGPVVAIDTAGDNLIVVRTDIGQASPAAVAIDRAGIDEIVGTVAGDDTILIAVKNAAAQRLAIKKIVKLFAPPAAQARRAARRASRRAASAAWPW